MQVQSTVKGTVEGAGSSHTASDKSLFSKSDASEDFNQVPEPPTDRNDNAEREIDDEQQQHVASIVVKLGDESGKMPTFPTETQAHAAANAATVNPMFVAFATGCFTVASGGSIVAGIYIDHVLNSEVAKIIVPVVTAALTVAALCLSKDKIQHSMDKCFA